MVAGRGEVAVAADEAFVVEGEAVDRLFLGGGLAFGGLLVWIGLGSGHARGAGHGGGGDLTVIDEGAGALGVEFEGEEAVRYLGENELKGGVVFEERDDDVVGVGEDGVAVVGVGVAEVSLVVGAVFAAVAVGGDGAAAFSLGRDCCVGGFGYWVGHGSS
ncbi:MAG TPA: hypothetical protein VHU89_18570 [Acidobacteriaceae bacterium]|nr:hypothetical protein [Acidobacteriaceae bacterium]